MRDITQPTDFGYLDGYANGPDFDCPRLAVQAFGDVAEQPCLSHVAYLYRRFGPPFQGSDDHKEIATWLLTTGIPGLYFEVSCKASALKFCFRVAYTRELAATFSDSVALGGYHFEIVACFRELLRPVFVRDIPINLLGRCSDATMARNRSVEPSRYAGYGCSRAALEALIADDAKGDTHD